MSLWIWGIAVTAAKVAYWSIWIKGAGVEQSRACALDETVSYPIEAEIGRLKREHRMDRNQLNGKDSDCVNAILSAAGMNFAKLLNGLAEFLRFIFAWSFNCQRAFLAAQKI